MRSDDERAGIHDPIVNRAQRLEVIARFEIRHLPRNSFQIVNDRTDVSKSRLRERLFRLQDFEADCPQLL